MRLSESAMNLAKQVASNVAATGNCLRPIENTPLSWLLKNLEPASVSTESLGTALADIIKVADLPTSPAGGTVFSDAVGILEEKAMVGLKQQLDFTRNVVNPIIRDISSKVERALDQREKSLKNFKVVALDLPDCVYSSYGSYIRTKLVSSQIDLTPPPRQPNFKNLDQATFIDKCKTKYEDVNEQLAQITSEWNTHYDTDYWDDVMAFISQPSTELAGSHASHRNTLMALMAFSFIENLNEELIPGMGLSTDEFRAWFAFFRNQCARLITVYAGIYSNMLKSKQVLMEIDQYNKVLTVIGPVYKELQLADKGEVMVGIVNTENWFQYRTLDAIHENQDKLAERGRLHLLAMTERDKNLKAARTRDAMVTAIIDLVEDAKNTGETHPLYGFIPETTSALMYRTKSSEYLAKQYPGVHLLRKDLREVTADVICHCFFPDSIASIILKKMVEVEVSRPNANMESIVTIALIEMLTEWVASQIEVVPMGPFPYSGGAYLTKDAVREAAQDRVNRQMGQ